MQRASGQAARVDQHETGHEVGAAHREACCGVASHRVAHHYGSARCQRRGRRAYLDVCLAERATRALALQARSDPALRDSMAARHDRFADASIPSLKAMGWPAAAASQLITAMTAEIAVRELDAGGRLPSARRALRRFLTV